MKRFILLLILIISLSNCFGQKINSITTDQDCLKFIRNNIDGQESFYFDTIFSKEEIKKLKPSFKSWKIFDFNNDKRPDLFFIGRYKDDDSHWIAANLYLSENNSYKLMPLIRESLGWYRPFVFVKQTAKRVLLIIHQYAVSEFEKIDDFLDNEPIDDIKTCKGNDTLIYKYNSLLNFTSKPSNITFDSLILKIIYGWSSQRDSFIVYQNGRYKYFRLCGNRVVYEQQAQKDMYNFERLVYLVKEIDSTQTASKFMSGGTDNHAARLKIFFKGTNISFYDYGMQSSFTLKSIYQYFDIIRKRFEEKSEWPQPRCS
jgi:hypothetical protein